MNFFGDQPPSTEDNPEFRELHARHPGAIGAPSDWVLPAILPIAGKLGEGPAACVALEQVRCWPDGVTLDLAVFLRRWSMSGRGIMPLLFDRGPGRQRKPGDLRFGVLFSDGRRVTNLDTTAWPPPRHTDPEKPTFWPGGGSGGQFHYRHEVYLTPLPPDGPLTLVVEWPDQQVPETSTELDGSAIRAAADEALEIWSDLPPPLIQEGHTVIHGTEFGSSGMQAPPVARRNDA